MNAHKYLAQLAVIVLFVAGASSPAIAQQTSTVQPIALSATLTETLTVGLSANSVGFNLTAGSAANPGSTAVTATTSWVLRPGRTAVKVYAYFGSATAALTDSTNNIPSSAFFISDNGGASTAVTQSITGFGAAGAALQLGPTTNITNANRNSSRTDIMTFNINLTALPQLPASTYDGTLSIQAQATP